MGLQHQQHDYEKLSQSLHFIDKTEYRPKFRIYAGGVIIALFSSVVTVAVVVAIGLATSIGQEHLGATSSPPSLNSPWGAYSAQSRTNCGRSIKEALSLNCTYDHLSKSWLPDFCPRDLNQEFILTSENGTEWKYFRDREATIEIKDIFSLAHLGPGEMWFSTKREHIAHCRYMILRLHRALERACLGDFRMDATLQTYAHTEHCVGMMYDMASKAVDVDSGMGSNGDVVFGTC